MGKLKDHIKEADWKSEKHVPVIDCSAEAASGEIFDVSISIGKEIAHPNTTEHHIRWISLYFHPENDSKVYQVGHYEFSAHGESAEGANQGPVYTHHAVTTQLKLNQSGMLHAVALCNIHGLWESSCAIQIKG